MRIAYVCALLAAGFLSAAFAAPAQAQRDRVFVASYGSDSNPCTFGSPCKTFQNAHNVVAAGGEITAIDSAGFGPININKAITITSPNGVEAGIAAAAGGFAIEIQAEANDTVVLRGLTLEGAGSGDTGIYFLSGARLEVVNCTIRNYTGSGIYIQASGAKTLLISNTFVSDNSNTGGSGVVLDAISGTSITAALDHVTANNNYYGVGIFALNGPVEASITNSQIDNNASAGVYIEGESTSLGSVILKNVTLNQELNGIYMNQDTAVWLSQVTQTGGAGFSSTNAVNFNGVENITAYSDGTNILLGAIANGTLTPYQLQ
jgi:hypothetical protein